MQRKIQATQVSQSNATVHNSNAVCAWWAVSASKIVVAHFEFVFAGLDEDKASSFRCRLPDLGGNCQ
jgi:hypothetical protein